MRPYWIMTILCSPFPCSPSTATSHDPPVARGNSPCPVPRKRGKERRKEKKRTVPPAFVSYSPSSSSSTFVGSGGSPRGPALAPTSVVRKKSRIGLVYRSSANRSRMLSRFFPLAARCWPCADGGEWIVASELMAYAGSEAQAVISSEPTSN